MKLLKLPLSQKLIAHHCIACLGMGGFKALKKEVGPNRLRLYKGAPTQCDNILVEASHLHDATWYYSYSKLDALIYWYTFLYFLLMYCSVAINKWIVFFFIIQTLIYLCIVIGKIKIKNVNSISLKKWHFQSKQNEIEIGKN